jgi:predicted dehydrogenase
VYAVIICLPNIFHHKVSRDALLSNKHVCCEKPLTVTLAEAEELSKVSLENKVVLFGAFHRRYNKNLLKVIDKLKSMPIVHVEGNYLDNVEKHLIGTGREWYVKMKSAGGGIIMVNGPNIYDPIVQFLGHLEVTGVNIKRMQEHDLDIKATIELISDQGVPVVIRMDWFFEGERKDVIVKFKDGTEYIVDMLAGSEAFKSSMWHEYEGVIEDFCARIDLCRMCYDNKTSMKDVPKTNTVNLDLHGREAVDIVRLVCNTYAKEIRQE